MKFAQHPALPTLILNAFIISAVISIALYLKQPLAILGLFWIQGLPIAQPTQYYEEQVLEKTDEEELYTDSKLGFTSLLKK